MSRQVVQGSTVRTVNEPVGSYLARSGTSFGGNQGFQNNRRRLPQRRKLQQRQTPAQPAIAAAARPPARAWQPHTAVSSGGISQGGSGASQESSAERSFHSGSSAPSGGGSAPSSGAHR